MAFPPFCLIGFRCYPNRAPYWNCSNLIPAHHRILPTLESARQQTRSNPPNLFQTRFHTDVNRELIVHLIAFSAPGHLSSRFARLFSSILLAHPESDQEARQKYNLHAAHYSRWRRWSGRVSSRFPYTSHPVSLSTYLAMYTPPKREKRKIGHERIKSWP